MPRYFFALEDHVHETDDTGTVLIDAAQARVQAIVFAGAILKDDPSLIWADDELKVIVTDEAGCAIAKVFVRAEGDFSTPGST